jgi:hypothetical protein
MSRTALLRIALALLVTATLSGCAGYRVGDVSGRDLQGVRTVYVPMAHNASLEPDIQATVTNDIIRRFNTDGTLVISQAGNADSELDVTVVSVDSTPYRSSNTDLLTTTEYQLTVHASVTYVNRKLGRKIFENTPVAGTTKFFTQSDLIEGERQAFPLASEDLANNVVQLVTEGW